MARYAFQKSYSPTSARLKLDSCSGVCIKRRSVDQALGTSTSTPCRLLQPGYSHAAEAAGDFRHLGLGHRLALLDRLLDGA
jgi:hypothetical protein